MISDRIQSFMTSLQRVRRRRSGHYTQACSYEPSCYPQFMANSDILSKADRALRPVLKELGRFAWIRIEGCCAGHKQEDSLWLEINVLGSSGLQKLTELLRLLDGKLSGTDCRVDCLLSYS